MLHDFGHSVIPVESPSLVTAVRRSSTGIVAQGKIRCAVPKSSDSLVLGSVLGKPKAAEGRDIRVEAFASEADPGILAKMADALRRLELTLPVVKELSSARLPRRSGLLKKVNSTEKSWSSHRRVREV